MADPADGGPTPPDRHSAKGLVDRGFVWRSSGGSHEQTTRETLPLLPVDKVGFPTGAGVGRQVCMVLPDHLGHPRPFSPQGPPSWANRLESFKPFCQEPGVSCRGCPALIPSMAKQTAALGPLPSPLPLLGGVLCRADSDSDTVKCGRGDVAPRLPSTPALCPPWLLGRSHPQEVGGVEMSPGLGVTRSL